jgi:CheY-like chemotaxis protein
MHTASYFSPPHFDELRKMTLLVVDDIPDNVDLVKAMLIKSGFTNVLTASSGHEALEYLRQYIDDKGSVIAAVLIDIMMPEMDGWEVCRAMRSRQEWADIPVLMITAYATWREKVARVSLESGATDIIFKPIRRAELIPRVVSALSLKKVTGFHNPGTEIPSSAV